MDGSYDPKAQPHLRRAERQLAPLFNRAGITSDMAGCEVLTEVDIVLILGEIPASVYAHG